MADSASALPDYDNPPVNEVVFGVQYQKIDRFQTPHTGLLWEKLNRERFPKCQEMTPINHILETPDGTIGSTSTIEFSERPLFPRILFFNSLGDQLIQVQQDRFLRNWRKLKPDDTYPRFRTLYPDFLKSWDFFKSFLKDINLPTPVPDQYELTYVNQITQGEGWEKLDDIEKVFRDFQHKTGDRFLPEPETLNWRRLYRLPDKMGRLNTTLKMASTKDGKKVMLFELTARGFGNAPMDEWFAMGREWIVKGFTDLTTNSIQKAIWKRKQ